MFKFHAKLWTLVIVWTLFLAAGFYALIAFSPIPRQIRPTHVAEQMSVTAAGSEGADRLAILKRDTRIYVQSHPDAPADVVAGKVLAPAEFLNDQLKRDGEKFRVRKVDGMRAEMFDVS